MKRLAIVVADVALSLLTSFAAQQANPQAEQPALQNVIAFEQYQPTGVAVSKAGRVFVNFPLWSDDHRYSVVEVMPDGSVRPYPDERWNAWTPEGSTPPSNAFVCVQSVWIDDRDMLWILDPAAPRMQEIVPGGPKLVQVDLATDQVVKVIPFDESIAPAKSYLNDVRVDTQHSFAYITDSGQGAIVVVNLQNNQARRLLENHPSTSAEPGVEIVIGGRPLRTVEGNTPQIHADGIALSSDGLHLYYHALTGKTLYRVPTAALGDEAISSEQLAERIENLGQTVVTDGMLIGPDGSVYHTALEHNAIMRFTPAKTMETVVQDDRIQWPDSMAMGPGGELYFTTSQIHRMPRFNNGQSTRTEPYRVFKFKLPDSSIAER